MDEKRREVDVPRWLGGLAGPIIREAASTRCELIERLTGAGDGHHLGAPCRQRERQRAADPARRPCHHCASKHAFHGTLGSVARDPRIHVFYRPELAQAVGLDPAGSQSPLKARLLLDHLARHDLLGHFVLREDFPPLERDDFLLAHTPLYVDAFFAGEEPLCRSNRLRWSPELAEGVRFSNASLVQALFAVCREPGTIALSPTCGYHHARPDAGSAYCTFSGQVIASVRVYRELGLSGAWLDLDGHFGNSIEDSRDFVPGLDRAVPRGCNINPDGRHRAYLRQLGRGLEAVGEQLLANRIHYVAFAHGADSHEWDENGYQLSTEEWVEAAEMVYRWVAKMDAALGRPVPLLLALFGGYRQDHYDSVLALHTADLTTCLNVLCGAQIAYRPDVRPPPALAE